MANFAAQAVTSSGVAPTANPASAGGDTVPPDTLIRIMNGGASPITVTAVTPGTVDGDLAIPDRTISIPNATAKYVKFAQAVYGDPITGLVSLTYSAVTTVTLELVR